MNITYHVFHDVDWRQKVGWVLDGHVTEVGCKLVTPDAEPLNIEDFEVARQRDDNRFTLVTTEVLKTENKCSTYSIGLFYDHCTWIVLIWYTPAVLVWDHGSGGHWTSSNVEGDI